VSLVRLSISAATIEKFEHISRIPQMTKWQATRFCAVVLAVLVTQGCANSSVAWTKPGTEVAETAVDLRECRRLANDEAWRLSWERQWPPRFYDRAYMPPFYRGQVPFWDDFPTSFERELALRNFCMHSKGYRLGSMPY
jgi:hypothetical protein